MLHYYEVNLYPQHGEMLDSFITIAHNETEALYNVVANLVNIDESKYYIEVGQIKYLSNMFGTTQNEYAADSGLLYIDATQYGCNRPVYIDARNNIRELSRKEIKMLESEFINRGIFR